MITSKLVGLLVITAATLPLLGGCQSQSVQNRKGSVVESHLYIEVIETQDGNHRFGIAHPGDDKAKMVTAEVDLPADGTAHAVTLDGHKITVFCRFRQEKPNQ